MHFAPEPFPLATVARLDRIGRDSGELITRVCRRRPVGHFSFSPAVASSPPLPDAAAWPAGSYQHTTLLNRPDSVARMGKPAGLGGNSP
jgi:hypothetical protein